MASQPSDNKLLFGSMKEQALYNEGATELSESAYNRTIGLMLTYGFGVNALITLLAKDSIYNLMYHNQSSGKFILIFFVTYLALAFGGSYLMHRSENPGTCFLGYNMIVLPVGVLLSMATCQYDATLVSKAMLITGIITLCMLILSSIRPVLFVSIGSALLVSLGIALLVEVIMSFVFHRMSGAVDWIVITIMSLYVGFDWARANLVQRTTHNAIAVSAALYLDIVNIFLRVLRLLGKAKSRD